MFDHVSCALQAERDKRRGMGVLLFHVEGTDENVVHSHRWLVYILVFEFFTSVFNLNHNGRSAHAPALRWFLVFLDGLLGVAITRWVFLSASAFQAIVLHSAPLSPPKPRQFWKHQRWTCHSMFWEQSDPDDEQATFGFVKAGRVAAGGN
jgi:hypothetical protein